MSALVLPKMIYTQSKSKFLFCGYWQIDSKVCMERQRPHLVNSSSKERSKVRRWGHLTSVLTRAGKGLPPSAGSLHFFLWLCKSSFIWCHPICQFWLLEFYWGYISCPSSVQDITAYSTPWNGLPLFSSNSFKVSGITLRSLIHFELSLYRVREFQSSTGGDIVCPAPFAKEAVFSNKCF